MSYARPSTALLAGVCAGMARTFGWNVWALRALFVIFLLVKPLWAVAAYAAIMLVMYLLDKGGPAGRAKGKERDEGLESPELARRNRRIAELERRFRDLENGGT